MDFQAHKYATLAHCLALIQLDPDYAVRAAGWYEALEPWLMANLQAKVRQEVRRSASSSPVSPSAE